MYHVSKHIFLTFILSVGLLSCKSLFTPKQDFRSLKVHYHISHDGYYGTDFEILDLGNKLLLIEGNNPENEKPPDSSFIDASQRKGALTFIDNIQKLITDCDDGWSVAGGEVILSINIDGKKLRLEDCMTDAVEIEPLLAYLKKKKLQ